MTIILAGILNIAVHTSANDADYIFHSSHIFVDLIFSLFSNAGFFEIAGDIEHTLRNLL